MLDYKTFRIYVTAVPFNGVGWYPRGVVLDPDPNITLEFQSLECRNAIYRTIGEAEDAAFHLCKHWIDKTFKANTCAP